MPESFTNLSLDNIIYSCLKKNINNNICIIHPNYITITNFFLSIMIIQKFYYINCYTSFIGLIILNRFLDIFDGFVARKCDKVTKFGKYLDITVDHFLILSILILTLFNISKEYYYTKLSLFILIIYIFCNLLILFKNGYIILEKFYLIKIIHDNTIISFPILGSILYFMNKLMR